MDAYEKMVYLDEVLGSASLLDSIFQWFPTSKIEECLDDIASDWDIDFDDEEDLQWLMVTR